MQNKMGKSGKAGRDEKQTKQNYKKILSKKTLVFSSCERREAPVRPNLRHPIAAGTAKNLKITSSILDQNPVGRGKTSCYVKYIHIQIRNGPVFAEDEFRAYMRRLHDRRLLILLKLDRKLSKTRFSGHLTKERRDFQDTLSIDKVVT